MKTKISILCILFLLLSAIAAADTFDVTVQALQSEINVDQQAQFLVTITNKLHTAQDYRMSFGDVGLWELFYTDPLSDYFSGINNLEAEGAYTTKVILKPIAEIGIGYHTVAMTFKNSKNGEEKSVKLPVYIKPINPTDKEYLPHVVPTVQLSKRIDPRQDNLVRIVLMNKNRKNLTYVEVKLESNIIKKTVTAKVEPLGKTVVEVPLGLDPLHPPEWDTLYVTVSVDKYTFKPDPVKFEIIDYSSQYLLEREEIKGFLLTTDKRVYVNDGNVPKSEQIKISTSLFSAIFQSSMPEPDLIITENGIRYRAWNVQLAPGEKFELELYHSYRILFYLFLLGLLGYYLYAKFKSPIIISKVAKNVEMREGGISEIKVMLNIKNRSALPLEHIEIIDKVPNIANLNSDYEIGTLRPTKVLKHAHKNSTMVQWNIDELDANEERVVVYRIRSRLAILGRFGLPLAMVKYSAKNGRAHKVFSNRLVIGK